MYLILKQYSGKVMREEVLERAVVRGGRGRGKVTVGDHVVDADDDVFDLRNEGVEAVLALLRYEGWKI